MKKNRGRVRNSIFLLCILVIFAGIFHGGCKKNEGLSEHDIEQQVLHLVNEYRTSMGLSPLSWNETIASQCRIHSGNMANGTIPLSHEGFTDRIDIIETSIPVNGAGENVAYNTGYDDPAKIAFNSWTVQTKHLQNLEGDYDLTGIGVRQNDNYEFYFTQIFVRKGE
jgi:uncharacterized protein YkwD